MNSPRRPTATKVIMSDRLVCKVRSQSDGTVRNLLIGDPAGLDRLL